MTSGSTTPRSTTPRSTTPSSDGRAVAVVTGASSGLGRACAVRLARDGLRVALLARDQEALDATADDVAAAGGQAMVLPLDLTDAAALDAAVAAVVDGWGRVDLLVNAAGTDAPGPVEDTTVEDWDRVLAVNLRAPFLLSRAVLPHMRRSRRGTVVTVSSVAGLRGWADAAAYCSSKFALTGLTQSLAAEGREHGIRACVLYPGAMDTAWGSFEQGGRGAGTEQDAADPTVSLPPDQVADLVAWIFHAPPGLLVNQVTVTPLLEQGWP